MIFHNKELRGCLVSGPTQKHCTTAFHTTLPLSSISLRLGMWMSCTAFHKTCAAQCEFDLSKHFLVLSFSASPSRDRGRVRSRALPAPLGLWLGSGGFRSRGSPKASLDVGFVCPFTGDTRECRIGVNEFPQIVDFAVSNASVLADDAA